LKQVESMMKRVASSLALIALSGGLLTAVAADNDAAKVAYYAAGDKAAADFRDAHAICDTMTGSAQTICIEEAKLAQTRAKGNAEAEYRKTPQARLKARTDIANAEYAVAKAKCESIGGGDKEACLREANALRAVAIAEAKAANQ
jgi:hypothetical protein